MKYIESFRDGEGINDIYLVRSKRSDVTKTGKPYDKLVLTDKTGSIDAMIWDPNSAGIDDFDVLDYILVNAVVNTYQGANQLNIKRVRKCSEGEYDPADYLPVSEYDVDKMWEELMSFRDKVGNKYLSQLLALFFDDAAFAEKFRKCSAAKAVHHGFIGGLLEHTLSVTKLCEYYTKAYPMLNANLLLTVAMLHDIGKTKELSDFPQNDYTDEGQLLGHIVMGAHMVMDKMDGIEGFPEKLYSEVTHCILAHHGEYEFGSPKKPAIMEAVALHFADNTDAKMETMKEIFSSTDNDGWLGFNRLIDSNIRKTSRNG
ncbi:MAG: HD domain-containing protein [Lachnospiraceae bacterium]|nr:HD domain-containing protein [Lachnospiraceae bacterium]